MKSLNEYVNESTKNIKPNENGEYEFWVDAKIVLNDHILVKADSFEDAKKKAEKIADEKVDKIPTKIGEVVEAKLNWENGSEDIW